MGEKINSGRQKKDVNIEYEWMKDIIKDLETAGSGAGANKKLAPEVRISQASFYNMKAGKLDNLNVGLIEKMCQLLQCQPSDLFRGWKVNLQEDLKAPKLEQLGDKYKHE